MTTFGKDFNWWKERAEQSKTNNEYDDDTYMNLANMYFEGEGIGVDYKKAFEWYKYLSGWANDDGYSRRAKIMMAMMYYLGKGVECNYDKAYDLAKQANEKIYFQSSKKNDALDLIIKFASNYQGDKFVENIIDSISGERTV